MKPALIVIDFQERLAKHVSGIGDILRNAVKLIKACRILGIPIILTEQIKLGETVKEVREVLDSEPVTKASFSCMRCGEFLRRLREIGPDTCILVGIEAHVCVLQTALDLLGEGYRVYVALDSIGSRRDYDKEVAVLRMVREGVIPATSEAIIYELLETAEHEKFREILGVVKEG